MQFHSTNKNIYQIVEVFRTLVDASMIGFYIKMGTSKRHMKVNISYEILQIKILKQITNKKNHLFGTDA